MPSDYSSNIPRLTGARLTGNNGHVYLFRQKLGEGQFGVVYKCQDAATSELYACKVMNMAALSGCYQVIQREVDILLTIKHEHLLRCHEQLYANNLLFVFTQYVGGGSLEDYLAKHIMSIDEIGRVVYQILDGVSYLHSHHISHRDLKPANILYHDRQPLDVVIADFGLSRTFDDENGGLMTSQCGSSMYAAPEVFRQSYTASCDMWSIGIITNEMIRGPYSGTPLNNTKDYTDEVPLIVRDFVGKLLKYDPQERMSAQDALNHPWMVQIANSFFSTVSPISSQVQRDEEEI